MQASISGFRPAPHHRLYSGLWRPLPAGSNSSSNISSSRRNLLLLPVLHYHLRPHIPHHHHAAAPPLCFYSRSHRLHFSSDSRRWSSGRLGSGGRRRDTLLRRCCESVVRESAHFFPPLRDGGVAAGRRLIEELAGVKCAFWWDRAEERRLRMVRWGFILIGFIYQGLYGVIRRLCVSSSSGSISGGGQAGRTGCSSGLPSTPPRHTRQHPPASVPRCSWGGVGYITRPQRTPAV